MSPAMRLRKIPEATRNDERFEAKRLATAVPEPLTNAILQREFIVSRYPLQEQPGRKSTTTVEGCALFEAGFSSTDFSLWGFTYLG